MPRIDRRSNWIEQRISVTLSRPRRFRRQGKLARRLIFPVCRHLLFARISPNRTKVNSTFSIFSREFERAKLLFCFFIFCRRRRGCADFATGFKRSYSFASHNVWLKWPFFCRTKIIDFHQATGCDGTHPEMFSWIKRYFSCSVSSTVLPTSSSVLRQTSVPPLYLQHQG